MLSRVSELEQELTSAQLQCEHYQTSLSQARDRVARLLSSASEGVCSVEETKELLEWMETLPGEERVNTYTSKPYQVRRGSNASKPYQVRGGLNASKTLPSEIICTS